MEILQYQLSKVAMNNEAMLYGALDILKKSSIQTRSCADDYQKPTLLQMLLAMYALFNVCWLFNESL